VRPEGDGRGGRDRDITEPIIPFDEQRPLLPAAQLDPIVEAAARGEAAVWEAATLAAVHLLGERGAAVLLDDADPEAAMVVFSTHGGLPDPRRLELARYPEITLASESARPVIIDQVATDARLGEVARTIPRTVAYIAAVPVGGTARCFGVLHVQASHPRPASPAIESMAAALGGLTGHLIEAARLRKALISGRAGGRAGSPTPPFGMRTAARRALLLRPAPAPIAPAPHSRRLLLVEDDPHHGKLVRELLAARGHAVELVTDGEAGLERARRQRFDVILLDVCMPGLDGLTVAERLREEPLARGTPILFLSGSDDLMLRVRGLELGSVDFLGKPFFAPELFSRVERCADDADQRDALARQARIDPLTGLGNLRTLEERLRLEESRATRYGAELTIVMVDVDGLKRINDQHGHAIGSRVLATVGRVLAAETRGTDIAVRYGGDEFVVLLTHAGLDEGRRFAARVIERLRAVDVDGVRVSASLGLASIAVAAATLLPSSAMSRLIERADAAAYEAKRAGGDRVCTAEP
jgi:diguanylate cyclase (GGDEF)-like protein